MRRVACAMVADGPPQPNHPSVVLAFSLPEHLSSELSEHLSQRRVLEL